MLQVGQTPLQPGRYSVTVVVLGLDGNGDSVSGARQAYNAKISFEITCGSGDAF